MADKFLLLLVAAALLTLANPLSAQVGAPEVERVRFLGNETFPGDSLERAIVTRPTRCRSNFLAPLCWAGFDFAFERRRLRPVEVPRDRLRLEIWYRQRGFREVVVDTATSLREDDGAEVVFTVDEGRPVLVDELRFEGVGGEDDTDAELGPDLLDDLPLSEGDRLNVLRLDATRDTLAQRLRNRGYAHAEVYRQSLIPVDQPYSARVTFEVEPGTRARYGRVDVSGTRSLDESTVMRTLQFRPGDLYRADQLLDGQARLFGMEIVRSAQVTADLESGPDSIVPVSVSVAEADAYRVRAGAGWTSAECLNVESTWTSRNFFGGGRVLRLRGRVSNVLTREFGDLLCAVPNRSEVYEDLTWVASADFAQPWIFSTRNSFGASLFAERQALPDIFVRRSVGLQLGLTRAIGPQTPLTLSYRPEWSQLQAAEVLFCTGFLVCTPEDIAILGGTNILAPVGLSFSRDRSNDLLNPTRGYRLRIELEHAADWTGSDFRFDRSVVEGTSYTPLAPGWVLAGRLRAGWVGSGGFDQLIRTGDGAPDIVHPQKRFYAGGANSVRGFAQGRLGPRVLTVADPTVLLDSLGVDDGPSPPACTPAELIDLSCDASRVPEERFTPRPVGGNRVLEGNVEVRFGLGRGLEGVAFGDFGQVWGAAESVSLGDLEITPGLGVRFLSPVGPIRIDVGYRFRGPTALPVIAPRIVEAPPGFCPDGASCLEYGGTSYVPSGELGILSSLVRYGAGSRFQLHFSIGQAF